MNFSTKIFTVSEINNYVKNVIDSDTLLSGICVEGELSNFKRYPSGHCYFSIKDKDSTLKCIMFRSLADKLRFIPQNGMTLICYGKINVYERDGIYQLYCDRLVPAGRGELAVAFEQLKERLFKEGLFSETHKKAIPHFPSVVAVITSSAGAAVRDIIRVSNARWPLAEIKILPVSVQGEKAAAEISGAIRFCNKYNIGDVIITGRGGGSMEDLWCFNDEKLARAIYESEIPVISAVGHEPDFTICDFVADLRAATPSNGAELALPSSEELLSYLSSLDNKIRRITASRIENSELHLKYLEEKAFLRKPEQLFEKKILYIDSLYARIFERFDRIIADKNAALSVKAMYLDAASPLKTLTRGYAIVSSPIDGKTIKSILDLNAGDKVSVRLSDGNAECTVTRIDECTARS